ELLPDTVRDARATKDRIQSFQWRKPVQLIRGIRAICGTLLAREARKNGPIMLIDDVTNADLIGGPAIKQQGIGEIPNFRYFANTKPQIEILAMPVKLTIALQSPDYVCPHHDRWVTDRHGNPELGKY